MADTQLKDGSITKDRRLDRLVEFDERSRQYPIRTLVDDKKLRSYTWRLFDWLDQGPDGACVGFAWAHELQARPKEVQNISYDTAMLIYYSAQMIDPWPGGAYPHADPFMEGTSVLAAAKQLHRLGFFEEYRWAFSLDDAVRSIGHEGPGILGTYWYEGMMDTDEKGFIKPTGGIFGGHAVIVRGVNFARREVRISNSWGKSWGLNGDALMTFDDFEKCLMNNGEYCIPVNRIR